MQALDAVKTADSRGRPTPSTPETDFSAVRSRLPSKEESAELASVFRMIGDPTRARILYALLDSGELCVGDLSRAVGASDTTVSHALRVLRMAGIVRRRRLSRMAYYSLHDSHVSQLLQVTWEHLKHS